MSTILEGQVKISDQREALSLYLEGLFHEQPETAIVEDQIAPETITKVDTEQAEEVAENTLLDGQPEWAEKAFQTLFIDIDGMDIAIPMEAMSGIRKYPDELTQLPNTASWVDGTFKSHGQSIQVVNARKLFLLSNNREVDGDEELKAPEFIVQIGDGRWGLACHSADRAVMLEPEQVRWSGAERRRPWMLGMIKEHLCALLDGDEFIKYLDDGAKPIK